MTPGAPGVPWWGLEPIAAADPETVWAQGAGQITYGRLQREMDAVRARLRAHGVVAGSPVAVQLPPSLTLLWWLFALWAEGAQVLLLDTRMKPAEVRSVLARIRPAHRVTSTTVPDLLVGTTDTVDVSIERIGDSPPGESAVALIQCSSGTTGQPKIVARSGPSLLADVDRHARNPGMPTQGERVLLLASLTHGFGLAAGVLHSLRVGATLVLPGRISPDDLLTCAHAADVHAVFGVPVHFDLLSQAAGGTRPTGLRLAVSCGDVLPSVVRQRFLHRYGVPVGQAYGMTEVGAIATDLTGDLEPPAVGRVLPGVDVRITDGELFIRADGDPYLYADLPDRYSDGWLRTFDRAELAPGSRVLSLLGRADSVCIIGGLKVDLTEVETALNAHPQVTEAMAVCRAVDSAVPGHPRLIIEAYVAADSAVTGQELTSWCRGQLSDFKIPRHWRIGTDLPRTTSGKANRGVRA
ncbi:class I adenylate-forming enzyme family protein [Streptomyces monticola]|uniref:Class I adenylate-forming enzyme family protein n=1 Tax=Streptomyces monticola TaxID=2666263 RepID=A0ABW2JFC8_9ACTN